MDKNMASGSKSVMGEILTRQSTSAPSILRRKRKLPTMDQSNIPSSSSLQSKRYTQVVDPTETAYVRELASRYTPASLMHIRTCPMETMQSGIVIGRLRGKGADCDVSSLSCRVNLCGRQFESVQVLAWHMSYSHTDLSSRSANAAFCFVCGHQMTSPKGKTAHLLSKHRDIFQQHHQQCLNQQHIVYAPNAPAAARLAEDQFNPLVKRDIEGDIEGNRDVYLSNERNESNE